MRGKLDALARAVDHGSAGGVREACVDAWSEQAGALSAVRISRSKGYKWLARYMAEGRAGLADRSRRPHLSPRRTASAVEAEVLRIRADSNNAWGGRKIAHVLVRDGAPIVPAASTITEILRRHGKLEQRAGEHPERYQRFEREHPNELWQMDFKGDFA